MSEIIVKKVNLQQDEVDRLENTIELRDNTLKYQQDQYLKLLHKLDNKEPFGLNYLLFTYDELVKILRNKYHPLHDYIYRWFGEEDDDGEVLVFSEDGIEVEQGDYWLVNVIDDIACTFKDIERLNRMIYKLEGGEKE